MWLMEPDVKSLTNRMEQSTCLHVNLKKSLSRAGTEAVIPKLTGSDREYPGAKIDLPATGSGEPVFSGRQ